VSSSPRQLQRVYAQFGETTFKEDLHARRMTAAAELLIEQRAIPVRDVARLVGYRQAPHFAQAFRRRYGLSPSDFREQAPRGGRKIWSTDEQTKPRQTPRQIPLMREPP
jgi:AraC-like DNA-binding protein